MLDYRHEARVSPSIEHRKPNVELSEIDNGRCVRSCRFTWRPESAWRAARQRLQFSSTATLRPVSKQPRTTDSRDEPAVGHIQPDEGISSRFGAKARAGHAVGLVNMEFEYARDLGRGPQHGVGAIVADACSGTPLCSARGHASKLAGRLSRPIWSVEDVPAERFPNYDAGTGVRRSRTSCWLAMGVRGERSKKTVSSGPSEVPVPTVGRATRGALRL